MLKKIALLGSTGSIGRQTLEVVENLGEGYAIVALTAGSNRELLEHQVRRFKPELAVLSERDAAAALECNLHDLHCRVEAGPEGQLLAARWPAADLVVVALVGFSGFLPTLAALEEGKTVALANKEALVVGGELLARRGLLDPEQILPLTASIPLSSSLSAALLSQVHRIWLTASGPFRDWEPEQLAGATPAGRWPIPTGGWGQR